ncbi:MAG TPA: PEP-CTERM sorting domain-containing protein [Tepidisphaeraceae bacterium]|jgi:hypothetical protein|nr:PEP-CTERM sorting domain-containing protein [Tepidisphaeraceae bacterium]
MKKIASFLAVLVGMTTAANAAPVKFVFDPNTLLDATSTSVGLRAEQAAPRLVVGNRSNLSGVARTFYTNTNGDTNQPNELNAYNNWVDSLGSTGEGITAFNMWVTTTTIANNPYNSSASGSWKQGLYRDGTHGNTSYGLSATAADGWNALVTEVFSGTYGVMWYTLDSTKSIRPTKLGGADLPNFSFSMIDSNAVVGEDYRLWVGASAGGPGTADTGLKFDTTGWGNRTTTISPFASTDGPTVGSEGSVWQGIITVTAVPEPNCLGLLSVGLLAMARRR